MAQGMGLLNPQMQQYMQQQRQQQFWNQLAQVGQGILSASSRGADFGPALAQGIGAAAGAQQQGPGLLEMMQLQNAQGQMQDRQANREREASQRQQYQEMIQGGSGVSGGVDWNAPRPGNPDLTQNMTPEQRGLLGMMSRDEGMGLLAGQAFQSAGKDRRIVKGADGKQYYADTQEPVLPGVQAADGGQDAPAHFMWDGDRLIPIPGGKLDPQSPANKFDRASKLRGEFTKGSKDWIKVRDAHARVEASAKDPSAAGDLAMIFNYMKVLDPGSTVREGEFATAQNSAGVPERLRAKWNQVLRGDRLAPKQRADFLDRSRRLATSQFEQHQNLRKQYGGLSDRAGLSRENVIVNYGAGFDPTAWAAGQSTETAAPESQVEAPSVAPPAPSAVKNLDSKTASEYVPGTIVKMPDGKLYVVQDGWFVPHLGGIPSKRGVR